MGSLVILIVFAGVLVLASVIALIYKAFTGDDLL